MTPEELFALQLRKPEGATIDFKRDHYDRAKRAEFIKDVLAMANTPREDAAYIVLGVLDDRETGTKELVGLDRQEDDSYYTDLLGTDNVSPLPKLEYIPVISNNLAFGLIKIGISSDGPFLPLKKLAEGSTRGSGGCDVVPKKFSPTPLRCGSVTSGLKVSGETNRFLVASAIRPTGVPGSGL